MGAGTMARKKGGRPKGDAPPRETMPGFRASAEFRAWFEELVGFSRMPASSVIENALVEYARVRGFDKPAPKR